ncbi:MAG: hypothetical protein HZA50_06770 [Planctomycetes bacterium]|nr:hypothetical protein [Planctomycetota bacterium]
MSLLALACGVGLILLAWLALGMAFTGIGLAARRMCRAGVDSDGMFESFWMGFCVTIMLLQVWHFFLPVNGLAFLAILVPGLVGLAWNYRGLSGWLKVSAGRNKPTIAALLLLAVWLADRSAGPCVFSDTKVYHAMAVQWAGQYPVVPGIANLYGPLAFNNSSFLYDAMLENGFWRSRAFHIADGLLLAVLIMQCATGAFRMFRPNQAARTAGLFETVLLVPLAMLATGEFVSSFSTDIPAIAICFAAAAGLLRLLINPDWPFRRQAWQAIWLTVLLSAATCIKLTSAGFAIASIILAWIVLLVRSGRSADGRKPVWKTIAICAGLGALAVGPWFARGVIMSGYPLFPNGILPFNVEWKAPAEHCIAYTGWIHCWTRKIDRPELMDNFRWLGGWLESIDREIIVAAVLIAAAVVSLAIARLLFGRRTDRAGRSGWLVLLPAAAAISFWFFTVPQTRFGFFAFWILAGAIVAVGYHRYADALAGKKVAAIYVLIFVSLAVGSLKFRQVFVGPGPDFGMHPMPAGQYDEFFTAHNLRVYRPVLTDETYYAPLPCSPYHLPFLRLRRPGDLAGGFVHAGPPTYPTYRWNPDAPYIYPSYGIIRPTVKPLETQPADIK